MPQTKNSLQSRTARNSGIVEYNVGDGTIKLSPSIVRHYLVSGDADRVTDQEVMMFMSLCKYQHLNPWLHEAYCIKYGNMPATLVVGKAAFQKRAEMNINYDGSDSGIIVENVDGIVEYRRGTLKLPTDTIVGGWAEVYRKDWSHPIRCEVSFDEYAGRKKDGSLNSIWSSKPATMIRKVALVHALRDAFPSALSGMYTAEEQGASESETTYVPMISQEEAQKIEQTGETPTAVPEESPRQEQTEDLFS